MNGTLNHCPMFSTWPASKASWSFLMNSSRKRVTNTISKNTPMSSPSRRRASVYQYIGHVTHSATKQYSISYICVG